MKNLLAIIFIFTTYYLFGQGNIVFDDNYKCSGHIDTVDGLPVYTIVEQMPEFVGGEEARMRFLVDRIEYVKDTSGILETSVYTTFIIDTAGNVTNICLLRSQFRNRFTELEKRTMRVLASMPRWKPGEQGGRKVPVRFTMPIKFEPTN